MELFIIGSQGQNFFITIDTETTTIGAVKQDLFRLMELRSIANGRLLQGLDGANFDAAFKNIWDSYQSINYKIHMPPPKKMSLKDVIVQLIQANNPKLAIRKKTQLKTEKY